MADRTLSSRTSRNPADLPGELTPAPSVPHSGVASTDLRQSAGSGRARDLFWSGSIRDSRYAKFAGADTSPEQRIGRQIKPQPNGCWLFKGNPDSYGNTTIPGFDSNAVHRFVYETLVGPIDEGCHVHHTCLTPGCCNPEHVIVLTPKEHRAEHSRLRQANRPPRSYQPDKRVGGKRRKELPVFKLDPATGKYRKVG